MTAGLQIFDNVGRIWLDGTTRCGRVLGMQRIRDGAGGSVSADLSRGTPFWSFMPDWLFQHISMNAPVPIVQIGAGGISWRYSADGNSNYRTPVPGWLIFGVF